MLIRSVKQNPLEIQVEHSSNRGTGQLRDRPHDESEATTENRRNTSGLRLSRGLWWEGVESGGGLRQAVDAPTGVGFIIVEEASGHNCITIDPGANELLSAAEVSECEGAFESATVLLTQLEIPVAAAEAALRCGRSKGLTTILNPAPVRALPPSVLELIDVLTPNEVEAKLLAGRDPDDTSEPEEVARQLIRSGVNQVVMTLGEKGALIVSGTSSTHVPAARMSAVDTTGAGDAFNAGLATALASGAGLESGVRFAVVAGGLAVTREGVIPSLPQREEVLAYHRQNELTVPGWFAAISA